MVESKTMSLSYIDGKPVTDKELGSLPLLVPIKDPEKLQAIADAMIRNIRKRKEDMNKPDLSTADTQELPRHLIEVEMKKTYEAEQRPPDRDHEIGIAIMYIAVKAVVLGGACLLGWGLAWLAGVFQ